MNGVAQKRPGMAIDLLLVSIVHACIIGSLSLSLFLPGCAKFSPDEKIMPIELMVEVPPGTEDGLDDFDPAASVLPPPPAPDDLSLLKTEEPPADAIAKKAKAEKSKQTKKEEAGKKSVKTESGKVKPDKVMRSNKRVRNPFGRPGAKVPKKILTAAEIRRYLAAGAKIGDRTTEIDAEQLYLETVRHVFYQAWDQPTTLKDDGLKTRVEIELGPGGTVRSGAIVGESNNRTMDDSVMRAVRSVSRIPDLPPSFIARHGRIRVTFELRGEM